MAKRLTMAQLAAQLEHALVRANKAEAELASLRSAVAPVRDRGARPPRTAVSEYQRACAKARDLAMRSGKCVSVSE